MEEEGILRRICTKLGGVVRQGVCHVKSIMSVLKVLDDIDRVYEEGSVTGLFFSDSEGNMLDISGGRGWFSVSVMTPTPVYVHEREEEIVLPGVGKARLYSESEEKLVLHVNTNGTKKPSEVIVYALGKMFGTKWEEVAKSEVEDPSIWVR